MNDSHIVLSASELRSLQKKGLEIFKYVIIAIEKMGLTYYCVGGTALGAVKYGGFIPWDDDIDIAMPRNDYMRFLLEGKQYLPSNLFISSCFTEDNYFGCVAKVRDINTSYFDVPTAKFNICHGAFVDIFPIDGYVTPTKMESFMHKVYLGRLDFAQSSVKPLKYRIKGFLAFLLSLGKSLNKCCKLNESLLMKHDFDSCSLVFNRIMVFDKLVFGEPVIGTFEGIEVNLPNRIDQYLFQCFGDIKRDIPKEKQIPHHYALLIDLVHSYTEYQYKKGKIVKK